jgi:secondary thiamine-phosphate synthase enzyme
MPAASSGCCSDGCISFMRQLTTTMTIASRGRGLHEFTGRVRAWIRESGIRTGLLTLFVRHTSASLLIQENADPEVQSDLERFLRRLVPDGDPLFEHTLEGPDDMPAHVRAALTQTQLSIPVVDGAPALGTWQGIYLYEHRTSPYRREVILHLSGE